MHHHNHDANTASSVSLDSPQCIIFGLFIIWFASFTINLGPTLLSGALTSSRDTAGHVDACPMVYGPVRHYVLNVLWVTVNVMCVALTGVHLRKLYRDLTRYKVASYFKHKKNKVLQHENFQENFR